MSAKDLFTEAEKTQIVNAITAAEKQTSGEIRVHLDAQCKIDPVEQAKIVFEKIGMHETALRNGVLIYLAVEDRKLAIIGDKGIYEVVPTDFWDGIKNEMVASFSKNEFTKGLVDAIKGAGEQLKKFFPIATDDSNELSNDITFDHEI